MQRRLCGSGIKEHPRFEYAEEEDERKSGGDEEFPTKGPIEIGGLIEAASGMGSSADVQGRKAIGIR